MGRIVIDEDCFTPRKFTFIEYSGSDPFVFSRDIRKIVRPIFEVGSSKIAERRFMWDWTGDPIQLYNHFVIRKPINNYTTIFVSIRIIGFKSKGRNEGKVRFEFEPQIRHTFGTGKVVTNTIWWIYWYIFYAKIRQNILNLCREYTHTLIQAIKDRYGIKKLEKNI